MIASFRKNDALLSEGRGGCWRIGLAGEMERAGLFFFLAGSQENQHEEVRREMPRNENLRPFHFGEDRKKVASRRKKQNSGSGSGDLGPGPQDSQKTQRSGAVVPLMKRLCSNRRKLLM